MQSKILPLTKLTILETIVGEKPKSGAPFWAHLLLFIISLPFKIVWLILKLFGKGKDYINVTDSNWTSWSSVNGHIIERKNIAETGFDECIKFYNLKTNDKNIDLLLERKIFGEFHCETDYGLFLRQFDDPDDWPVSYLVFIDKSHNSYQRLKKIKSSW